jgi:hypothetical protein
MPVPPSNVLAITVDWHKSAVRSMLVRNADQADATGKSSGYRATMPPQISIFQAATAFEGLA